MKMWCIRIVCVKGCKIYAFWYNYKVWQFNLDIYHCELISGSDFFSEKNNIELKWKR